MILFFLDHALKTKACLKSTISQLDTSFIFIVFLCYYYFLKKLPKHLTCPYITLRITIKKHIHKFESQSMASRHLKKKIKHSMSPLILPIMHIKQYTNVKRSLKKK
jgi:hypothetical protein